MSFPFLNLIKQRVFPSHSANNKGLNGDFTIIWLIMCSPVQVNVVCVRLKFKVCTCWNESHYWNVYDRCSAQWTWFGIDMRQEVYSRYTRCLVKVCLSPFVNITFHVGRNQSCGELLPVSISFQGLPVFGNQRALGDFICWYNTLFRIGLFVQKEYFAFPYLFIASNSELDVLSASWKSVIIIWELSVMLELLWIFVLDGGPKTGKHDFHLNLFYFI